MNKTAIEDNLFAIRKELDKECNTHDITAVQMNLLNLQALSGLCAEVIKYAEIDLYNKQEKTIDEITDRKNSSIFEKKLQGKLAFEYATLNYSKNILKCIEQKCNALRTVVSLYKIELDSTI